MSLQKLQTIFDSGSVKFCAKNDLYGFEINLIKPILKDYQLVFTNGLSNYLQPVNENFEYLKQIELYMCLPEYWDLDQTKWPIEWLSKIASVPQKNKTWFGPGDTIPAGQPPQHIDEKLKANYFILSEPILLADELGNKKWSDSNIQWLSVIPIFKKEFDFKTQNSAQNLFEKFASKNVTELIDIYREPVGRKKFMGLF